MGLIAVGAMMGSGGSALSFHIYPRTGLNRQSETFRVHPPLDDENRQNACKIADNSDPLRGIFASNSDPF